MTWQTVNIIIVCILVLFVPATRTELRNTRESPLQPIAPMPRLPRFPAQREWIVNASGQGPTFSVAVAVPYTPPATGYRPRTGPAKRRIAPGYGKLARTQQGPLAWIWAPLDRHEYPVRRASDGRILVGAT